MKFISNVLAVALGNIIAYFVMGILIFNFVYSSLKDVNNVLLNPSTITKPSTSGKCPMICESTILETIQRNNNGSLGKNVIDASLLQTKCNIKIELTVKNSVSIKDAKDLIENFVIQVKKISPDRDPIRLVGLGEYDYIIDVYRETGDPLLSGTKKSYRNYIKYE